jgi:hypothetical protein
MTRGPQARDHRLGQHLARFADVRQWKGHTPMLI